MAAYYNENDPRAAAWLRELIKGGHIAAGEVDPRSIIDVTPSDLDGFTQCHFFAGIGGWSYALRLAGWPDERPVWTGSCPCQPFSTAGKGAGFADERHLWPAWGWLVRQCRPSKIFGEQSSSRAALDWLDIVSHDLEVDGYACGAAIIPAASVGAPHLRDRLYWMADTMCERLEGRQIKSSINKPNRLETWAPCVAIYNTRGDARIIEPGISPLAHGVPERVGLLRGYGNAIIPDAAAAFINATS